ncbi:MAG: response regulator transcription factor [Bacteroidia bacterium]|nr:response regulator transcription factor [Bacteroidia bacterium]
MKILIIEDEPELARSMADYLSGQQYRCETAATFSAAMDKLSAYDYDCILLDLMLPGGEGMSLLHELRRLGKQDGVIIISARDSLDDKIQGLQTGADDYLAKPFHLPELAARIYSLIRRKQFANSNHIQHGELFIDLLSRNAFVNGTEVPLTKKEFDLLLYFIGNRNRVLSKSILAEHLSGDFADMLDSHDFIYAHIKNLKRKLSAAGCAPYLKTVYGSGYKWEE